MKNLNTIRNVILAITVSQFLFSCGLNKVNEKNENSANLTGGSPVELSGASFSDIFGCVDELGHMLGQDATDPQDLSTVRGTANLTSSYAGMEIDEVIYLSNEDSPDVDLLNQTKAVLGDDRFNTLRLGGLSFIRTNNEIERIEFPLPSQYYDLKTRTDLGRSSNFYYIHSKCHNAEDASFVEIVIPKGQLTTIELVFADGMYEMNFN